MILYLKDFRKETLKLCLSRNKHEYYSKDLLNKCINAYEKDNLRYNTTTGETLCKSHGSISRYVNKSDIEPLTDNNKNSLASWAFVGWVRNSASRVMNGYSII